LIEIRTLRPEDSIDDLVTLSRDFFQEYEAHHPVFFKIEDLKDEQVRAYFARFTQDDDYKAFIALDGERIIGNINVYIKEQAEYWTVKQLGAISGLMVAESHRRSGIGGQMLERAIDFFAEKGVRYYSVYTATANQGAIDFYLSNGMAPLHTTLLGEFSK